MSEKLQKEYVEPYLEQNYSNLEYSIEFETTGKCIISGNCYKEPLIECDGNGCRLYEYLSIFECKSYFYTINVQDTETIITVFRKDGEYKLVEGRNIYEIDEEEDELKLKDLFDKDNTKLNNEEFIKKEESINNYPYESSYYTFASAIYNNRIHLDNNETIIRFFTGTLSDNSKIYISGNVANPLGLEGKIYMSTKYYDSRFNEIGICNDTIDLLGEGYSSISFACLISETDLMLDKKFSDVSYYKVSLHSLEIKE